LTGVTLNHLHVVDAGAPGPDLADELWRELAAAWTVVYGAGASSAADPSRRWVVPAVAGAVGAGIAFLYGRHHRKIAA